MLMQGWLPLNEYSIKHNVSISTLRRRIRASDLEYQFKDGKYWVRDEKIERAYKIKKLAQKYREHMTERTQPTVDRAPVIATDSVVDQLVAELKKAYVQALHEKEEMIMQLKEEAADLKTLVRILESENDRLRSVVHGSWSQEES